MTNTVDVSKERDGAFGWALEHAAKGDRIIYHVGQHCGGAHRREAALASDAGMCLLVTKRLSMGEGLFAYMAVKR